jgi:hypothetical protein
MNQCESRDQHSKHSRFGGEQGTVAAVGRGVEEGVRKGMIAYQRRYKYRARGLLHCHRPPVSRARSPFDSRPPPPFTFTFPISDLFSSTFSFLALRETRCPTARPVGLEFRYAFSKSPDLRQSRASHRARHLLLIRQCPQLRPPRRRRRYAPEQPAITSAALDRFIVRLIALINGPCRMRGTVSHRISPRAALCGNPPTDPDVLLMYNALSQPAFG